MFTLNATSIVRTPLLQQPTNGVESLWNTHVLNRTQETNKLNQTKAKTEKLKNQNYANQQSTNNEQTVSTIILNILVWSTVDTSYFINYTYLLCIPHHAACDR